MGFISRNIQNDLEGSKKGRDLHRDSISRNIQNDLEGSKKGRDLHRGVFVNFHQKLVVYYILDYFGILFILDLNSVLREFILWDERPIRDCFVKILRD